jgi:hypothetical protein
MRFLLHRSRRRLLVAALALGALAVPYGIAYYKLRTRHDFVHHATYYTEYASGRRVRTDTVGLGERRAGLLWEFAALVFAPATSVESLFWRWR